MKNKIVIILACCCLFAPDASYAKGLFKKLLGSVAEAASAAIVSRGIESCGYTREESQKYTRDIYSAFGSDCSNVERGLSYVNAEDKYARQNVAKDVVFDAAASISDNQEFVEAMRQMTDNTLGYLSARTQGNTDEDRKKAIDEYNQRSFDIMWDTYHAAKDRKAQRLAERMQLRRELINRGQDPELADEIAGQILIISKDESLSEQEKERYYRSFGLYDDIQQMTEMVATVLEEDEDLIAQQKAAEEQRRLLAQKEEEERKRQEELRKQRELEERNQAIAKINETVVNSYVFDEDALSEEQKAQLSEIASILMKYEDLSVELVGHTCKKGYKSVNKRIGLRRAETAKAYLVEQGVSEDRITTCSKGETDPKITRPTLEERKLNRRVEFLVK